MEIKVLGTGCTKCKNLENLVREVIAENQFNALVSKVEDIVQIMNYGVISTPGLVINEKVVISGRIPSKDEIMQQILKAQNG
jgi:small redox-active disulfide protein 2